MDTCSIRFDQVTNKTNFLSQDQKTWRRSNVIRLSERKEIYKLKKLLEVKWKNSVKNMSSEFDSFERLPFSLKLKNILSTQSFFIVNLFLEWLSYYSWNFLISLKDFQKPINWIKGLVIICLPSLFYISNLKMMFDLKRLKQKEISFDKQKNGKTKIFCKPFFANHEAWIRLNSLLSLKNKIYINHNEMTKQKFH